MRCYICNAEDETISYDHVDKRFSPCQKCQEVIYDTIISYDLEDGYLEELDNEVEREFTMDNTEY
jgi:predicted PP-loop superfamily ATPase